MCEYNRFIPLLYRMKIVPMCGTILGMCNSLANQDRPGENASLFREFAGRMGNFERVPTEINRHVIELAARAIRGLTPVGIS